MRTVTIPVIESEESYAAVVARMRELWGAADGSLERAELNMLATLVHAYEGQQLYLGKSTPQALVRSLMDSYNLVPTELIPIFGSLERVSGFLEGHLPLERDQAVEFHLRYRIPLELLLPVPDIEVRFASPSSKDRRSDIETIVDRR